MIAAVTLELKPIIMKTLFDQWYEGEKIAINNFTKKLFDAFMVADGANRNRLEIAFPEFFKGQTSL